MGFTWGKYKTIKEFQKTNWFCFLKCGFGYSVDYWQELDEIAVKTMCYKAFTENWYENSLNEEKVNMMRNFEEQGATERHNGQNLA